MKGSRLYMILLFAFLILVFLYEYMAPHKFSWDPTYDKNDKEPFGCYVFDDVVSSSVDDYSVVNKTFYQIFKEDSTISQHAFLIMENHLSYQDVDVDYLFKLVHLGNQVMICADGFPYTFKDTLCFNTTYKYHYSSSMNFFGENRTRDSIFFGKDTLNPERIFEVYPQLHKTNIIPGKVREISQVVKVLTPKDTIIFSNVDSAKITHSGLVIFDDEPVTYISSNDDDVIELYSNEQDFDEILYDESFLEYDEILYEDDDGDDSVYFEDEDEEFLYDDDDELPADSAIVIVKRQITENSDNIIDTFKVNLVSIMKKTAPEFLPLNCDSMEVLVWDNNNKPLAIRAFIGKGEIFLVSTPLMFTNYGMLDGNNASYIFNLLSYMKDKPLMRIEAYGEHGDNKDTPLRYILSEPPLRWAIYLTLLLIISFMFFAAKRRQRIIPIVSAPPNKTIEFMQLISNLYYQKHNNVEILKMKHTYFCSEIKSLIGVDLQENIPNDSDYRRLIEKTGLEPDFIRDLLKNIQMSLYKSETDDQQLKLYIDNMNKILRKLKILN